eukprot:m.101891 g.101891  ORF g.101891 m.101891 type:complete len:85 (+) comp13211_c0_seq1:74-328(+)
MSISCTAATRQKHFQKPLYLAKNETQLAQVTLAKQKASSQSPLSCIGWEAFWGNTKVEWHGSTLIEVCTGFTRCKFCSWCDAYT